MGEIRKHRSGFSQCRDSFALQKEWNMRGSSNSSPWSGNIWTYLAHTKLELGLSLHSLAAAGHRFHHPIQHPIPSYWECLEKLCMWQRGDVSDISSGIPAARLFPRVRGAGWVRRSRAGKRDEEILNEHNSANILSRCIAELDPSPCLPSLAPHHPQVGGFVVLARVCSRQSYRLLSFCVNETGVKSILNTSDKSHSEFI